MNYKSYNSFFFNELALKRLFFITLTSFVCVFAAFIYFKNIPDFCCDVYSYMHIAYSFDKNGFIYNHPSADIRNYLYPYLLSIFASDYLTDPVRYLLFTKSSLLFFVFISSIVFNFSLQKVSGKIFYSSIITLAVFLNPLLGFIYAVPLTEMYVFPLCLILFSMIILTLSTKEKSRTINFIVVMSWFLLAVLILIRPASIALFPALFIFFVVAIVRKKCSWKMTYLSILSFFIPLLPQFIFNYQIFNEISFFPVGGLGGAQLIWGAKYLKYLTLFNDGAWGGVKFSSGVSESLIDSYSHSGIMFYIMELTSSVPIMLIHMFNSINFDFLHPYVIGNKYSIISWYQILSSVLTLFGFTYCFFILKRIFVSKQYSAESIDADFILFIIMLSILGINAFVAVETRFGMIAHTVLTIFTIKLFFNENKSLEQINWKIFPFFAVLYICFSSYLSYFVVSLSPVFEINWF